MLKINLRPDGKTAKSVTYVDAAGQEFEQPGDLILLCGYGLMNVRMMLLSGIGRPYDPKTGKGTVGRNYCYQTQGAGARLIFEGKHFNPFIGAGRSGRHHRRFQRRRLRSFEPGFRGRRRHQLRQLRRAADQHAPHPARHAALGRAWKKATAETYQNAIGIGAQGSSYPVRGNYLDLDPTYTRPAWPPASAGHLRFPRK